MSALRLLPELEDSLRQIPGIRAASVVTGPDSHPTEVHVLASPGKPAKQVVRDVQSVAMAQFDLDIDRRIVSVVQLGEADAALTVVPPVEPPADQPGEQPDEDAGDGSADPYAEAGEPDDADQDERAVRPALRAIDLRTAGGEAVVTVGLAQGDDAFTGTATGPGLPVHRPRIVAQATVAAVAELLGMPVEVESAQLLEIGLRKVAVTVLSVSVPRLGEQVLCGSALVRGDEHDAIARSVLAALNRRLTG